MSRKTFSPTLYSTPKTEAPEPQEAEKGRHKIQIDLKDVERILDHLASNCNIKLKDLEGEVRNDFEQFISYVKVLYGKDEYTKVYRIIEQKFGSFSKFDPLTVGSYIAGCSSGIHGRDGSSAIISQICAGSLPNPNYPTEYPYTIVTGEYKNGRFTFTKQVDGSTEESRKHALIYVNFSNEKNFPGFCSSEISTLQNNLGIEKCTIKGYSADWKKPVQFYRHSFNVQDVKKRKGKCDGDKDDHDDKGSTGSSNGTAAGLAALIIIIIIILLLLFVFARNKRHR